MNIGILIAPGANAPERTQRAEEMMFDGVFFVDSPMIFGDPFVSMAAAAVLTRRIHLCVCVMNPVTRIVPVTAAIMASLNALAPGRIGLGIGIGFTGTGAMGLRAASLADLEEYVSQVRALLRGEAVEASLLGERRVVQFLNQGPPFVNLQEPVPVYVAAAGPRALQVAARIADRVILGGVANPQLIRSARARLHEATRQAGRQSESIQVAVTPSAFVSDEELDFPTLRELIGPKSLAPAMNFSRLADASPEVSQELKHALRAVRDAYEPPQEAKDGQPGYLSAYRGYMTELKESQRQLITPLVLESTSVAGTPDQCLRKLQELEACGVDWVILSPLPQYVDRAIEDFGRKVIPRLKG